MIKVTYVAADGAEKLIEAPEGHSVMEAAVQNGIEGIDAECGGACACATCLVYVGPEWLATVGEASEMEASMLEFSPHFREGGRLACQIRLAAGMDGLVVTMPESQY